MNFIIAGRTYNLDKIFLEKVADATFSYLNLKNGQIELRFVSSSFIQNLNNNYLGKNKPTDVLSFQLSKSPLEGQIFICYNYAKAQAKKNNKSFSDETALLLVHGILHIYGIDHQTITQEKKMQEIERKILNNLEILR